MFKGSIVALVTPLTDGRIDAGKLQAHIEWLIDEGVHGIVPCGTTGESATMTQKEHTEIIEIAVKTAAGKVSVIAGTGSNATHEAIELTKKAKDLGADGALLISPYYNKPGQEGLYAHHMAIADAVDIPQLLYNVPGRTSQDMEPATVVRLAQHQNIIGIKEATGSVERAEEIIAATPDDFLLICGDDAINYPMLTIGSAGYISVTANVAPKAMATMFNLFEAGETAEAREIHYSLMQLHKHMFLCSNPMPVKTALALMGRMKEEFRLPLVPMAEEQRDVLTKTLMGYKLI